MQALHSHDFVNRHDYGRAARVLELAAVIVLFTAFVMLFGAVLAQVV